MTPVERAETVADRLRRLVEERERLGLATARTREALAAAEERVDELLRQRVVMARKAYRGSGGPGQGSP